MPADGWIAILRLATAWEFNEPRRAAIERLWRDPQMSLARRFALALECGIQDRLLPLLVQLAQKEEPMSVDDAQWLGLERVLKICEVRERYTEGGAGSTGVLCHDILRLGKESYSVLVDSRCARIDDYEQETQTR